MGKPMLNKSKADDETTQKVKIPEKLRPYIDLGFDEIGVNTNQSYGTCLLCNKQKFYINIETGQFDCKVCAKSGNIYSFMELFLAECQETDDAEGAHWEELELDRGIPLDKLREINIAWDGSRWLIPAYNKAGALVHLGFYKQGYSIKGIAGLPVAMYGVEKLANKQRKEEPVYCVEGFWDMVAMELILEKEEEGGIVIAAPGAGTFKEQWAEQLANRHFCACYDNDLAGRQGTKKAYYRTKPFVKSFSLISWPDNYPESYDIRDFYRHDGSFEHLAELFVEYGKADNYTDDDDKEASDLVEFPPLSEGNRPSFKDTLKVYENRLLMTNDLRNALRVAFAVIISNQLPGEPLWMHIVGAPGAGKTELLTSCSEVGNTVMQSTLTPHSLVSGFMMAGGKDPSLLPRLFDKTFILKDYTEILSMPRQNKDDIMAILRGAYDGRVEKRFGTGESREYRGYFTMLTGVTPKIYGETTSSLGERFLLYCIDHIPGKDMSDVIRAAIENAGNEIEMKKELQDTAKAFLEWEITKEDLPIVPGDIQSRIVSLAQLVAMLRATVEKVGQSERILFRPSYEVATRLAKQFYKLIQALGLLNYPAKVGSFEYEIVKKVAMDSCIGWNRDVLLTLAKADGQTANDISLLADVPLSTIREHLNSLCMLKILYRRFFPNPAGRGGDIAKYYIAKQVKVFWDAAGMQSSFKKVKIRIGKKEQ